MPLSLPGAESRRNCPDQHVPSPAPLRSVTSHLLVRKAIPPILHSPTSVFILVPRLVTTIAASDSKPHQCRFDREWRIALKNQSDLSCLNFRSKRLYHGQNYSECCAVGSATIVGSVISIAE